MAKNRTSAQESLTKTGLNITGGLNFSKKPVTPLVEEAKEDASNENVETAKESSIVSELNAEENKQNASNKPKEDKQKSEDVIPDLVSKREKRTEREMFLLTPSAASWLSKTAKKNGTSKNDIINILIDNARKGQ